VAGIAAHIEGSVTAAVFRDIDTDFVAGEAQICVFAISDGRLKQLILIVGLMWIVALHAVTHRWWMNLAFDVSGFLVSVAGDA
jgi:hypothetical protein